MQVKRVILVSTIMMFTMITLSYISHTEDIPPKKPFSTFPTVIGSWKGRVQFFDPEIYKVLGVDDSFLCTYRNRNRGEIELYIGYYGSQREGDLIHSPKNCLPGSGWRIVENSKLQLPVRTGNGARLRVTKLMIKKGEEEDLVLYWFQSRGRIINSEYEQKAYLVYDSIIRHRTDGSFVRLVAPVVTDENETLKMLISFLENLVPILDLYIPS